MPTSIALVPPYKRTEYYDETGLLTKVIWEPGDVYRPLGPVAEHRASWKSDPDSPYNLDAVNRTTAEVITYSSDDWKFMPLAGVLGRDTPIVVAEIEERCDDGDTDYPELLRTLVEMGQQLPDAMWFVG